MNYYNDELLKIKADWEGCMDCNLSDTRERQVWWRQIGVFKQHGVMLLGDCPGKIDELVGEPFLGAMGAVLDSLLEEIGINHAFITNSVLCRSKRHREPKAQELEACEGRLQRTICAVKPHVIVSFGKTPYLWLCHRITMGNRQFKYKEILDNKPVSVLSVNGVKSYIVPTYSIRFLVRRSWVMKYIIKSLSFAKILMDFPMKDD